jgi:CheY-like chemotaxis protein
MTMAKNGRALLIDDDGLVRAMLTDMLQTFGYVVDADDSGEAALARFAAGLYDVVITDQRMPGMTGLEVAAAIRRIDPSLPVVLLTGGASVPAVEVGNADVRIVYKPVNVVKLMAELDTVRRRVAEPSTPCR